MYSWRKTVYYSNGVLDPFPFPETTSIDAQC